MLFDSYEYYLFLPIVFSVYWSLKSRLQYQNFLLLISSYFFYGWWDWRFLFLLLFNSLVDFFVGIQLDRSSKLSLRRFWLAISVIVNLGLLCVFKYFDFFSKSLSDLLNIVNIDTDPVLLNWILPIGISFYTFQTLSYSIDIFKKRLKPTSNIIEFLTYVSFFPQLVAGPIERASNILPQFSKERRFDSRDATLGMRQILWGLFKKLVIADNCATYVDYIFQNTGTLSTSTLILGAILFTYQVYCDFSGYTDIAIGSARLLGIRLMKNFDFPYFSSNMTEFYRRWHISLSTWIRDYVYIPLGLHLRTVNKNYRYVIVFLITFTLFGFWHGANWTYIVFGIIQGTILSYEYRSKKSRKKIRLKVNKTLYQTLSIFFTYSIWCFSCIFFRATSVTEAVNYLKGIFTFNGSINLEYIETGSSLNLLPLTVIIVLFMLVEMNQYSEERKIDIDNIYPIFRWSGYMLLMLLITNYGLMEEVPFIYFQF